MCPESHVEHLRAAADPEERQLLVDRSREQGILPGVAVTPGLVGLRMRRLPVSRGVHILPARDDEAVESLENGRRDLGVDRLRRQQHRDAARLVHRLEVHLRQEGSLHVPHPGLRLLQVRGQADERLVRTFQSHEPSPSR